MAAYYNEIDAYAAEWLRNLIKAGHIADGEVDTRSIVDVSPDELREFTQCHFFAGIAGWSHALRLAGWEDERQIWTGSCPCQPFSVAGQGKGTDDPRHLWPHFFRLIRGCRPSVVMGEQVAGAAGYDWLDGVRSDLESESYAIEGVDIPACAANAPHIRQRLYWVANASDIGTRDNYRPSSNERRRSLETGAESIRQEYWSGLPSRIDARNTSNMADTESRGRGVQQPKNNWEASGEVNAPSNNRASSDGPARIEDDMADTKSYSSGCETKSSNNISQETNRSSDKHGRYSGSSSFWHDAIWLNGADGKTRRAQPGICLLAHGIPARVGKLRAYGNAIVPPLAAEVIKAFMETL